MTEPDADADLKGLSNSAGVIATGFVAVLNFVGLKGAEVANIFRSESSVIQAVIYLLLAVSLLIAVVSIAVPRKWRMGWVGIVAIAILLLGIALLLNAATVPQAPITATPSKTAQVGIFLTDEAVAWVIVLVGLVATIVAVVLHFVPYDAKHTAPIKTILVLVAVALALIASYGGVRIEERSQLNSSYPQLSAQLKPASAGSLPTFDISAASSRMRYPSRVDFRVFGVRRNFDVLAQCGIARPAGELKSATDCNIAPCNYFEFTNSSRCDELVVAALQPDDTGAVTPKTFTVQANPQIYQQLEVFAQICTSPKYGDGCAAENSAVGNVPKFGFANLAVDP